MLQTIEKIRWSSGKNSTSRFQKIAENRGDNWIL